MDLFEGKVLENGLGELIPATGLKEKTGVMFYFTTTDDANEDQKDMDNKVKDFYQQSQKSGLNLAIVIVYEGEQTDATKQHFRENYPEFYLVPCPDLSASLKENYSAHAPSVTIVKSSGQVVTNELSTPAVDILATIT